ncbi:unnamed protein product, partial [Rotaria sp. Silwood1]
DWFDPPQFQSKVNRNWCYFLGVPIDTKGKLPSSELTKIISNVRRQIGMCRLIYTFSLMPVSNKMIDNLQKEINNYFWNQKRPSIRFKTCIGKKSDGGFGLIHLNTMISSFRIKCGLKIIDPLPKLWKFYAYQYSGLTLRSYAPWIWSNLVPHFDEKMSF